MSERREWEPEELIACWTLLDSGRERLANKTGATRLGFALMLKFFDLSLSDRTSQKLTTTLPSKGQPVDAVRATRGDIKRRVDELLAELDANQ